MLCKYDYFLKYIANVCYKKNYKSIKINKHNIKINYALQVKMCLAYFANMSLFS